MEHRRDLAEHFIAQQVPEFVVQALELVDIDHQYGHAAVEAARTIDFLHHAHLEIATVEDSGEPIEIGELLHSLHVVRVLNGGGANVGDRFQRLHVFLMKARQFLALQHQHSERLAE